MVRCFMVIVLSWSFYLANSQGLSAGGSLGYGSALPSPAANARLYYNIGQHFCMGPEFTYFLPKDHRYESPSAYTLREKEWEVNFIGHYTFHFKHDIEWYPLFGGNYTRSSRKLIADVGSIIPHVGSGSEEGFGAVLGSGLHWHFKGTSPYIEYQFIYGELSQHIGFVGVLFHLGKKEEHE